MPARVAFGSTEVTTPWRPATLPSPPSWVSGGSGAAAARERSLAAGVALPAGWGALSEAEAAGWGWGGSGEARRQPHAATTSSHGSVRAQKGRARGRRIGGANFIGDERKLLRKAYR